MAPALGAALEDKAHFVGVKFGVAICIATSQTLRVESRVVRIAAGEAFGMQTRSVVVSTWPRLRVQARAVRISARGIGSMSFLCHHIGGVVRIGAEKQVIHIHARRVVAPMQHTLSGWNRTVCKSPRQAMGGLKLASSNLKPSVAAGQMRRLPLQARRRHSRSWLVGKLRLREEPNSRPCQPFGIVQLFHGKPPLTNVASRPRKSKRLVRFSEVNC